MSTLNESLAHELWLVPHETATAPVKKPAASNAVNPPVAALASPGLKHAGGSILKGQSFIWWLIEKEGKRGVLATSHHFHPALRLVRRAVARGGERLAPPRDGRSLARRQSTGDGEAPGGHSHPVAHCLALSIASARPRSAHAIRLEAILFR